MDEYIDNIPVNDNSGSPLKNVNYVMKEIYDWVECVLVALVSVVVILTFIARVTVVDGSSMLPTLVDRELLVISHLFDVYDYNDIIVLQAKDYINEEYESGKPIVKRIIGLPGDSIEIDFENGRVYRNGNLLEQEITDGYLMEDGHYINAKTYLRRDMVGTVIVPENSYFVMGDNRNDSIDSRDNVIGFVDRHYIVGKVICRFMPISKFGPVN